VHAWHLRQLADLPVTGRRLVIELRLRRLVCQASACEQRTFRGQVPELALRCARRTLRLTAAVGRVAVALAGRAGAAMPAGLGVSISRSTMLRVLTSLRVLMALPIPSAPTPGVLGVDDVAPRRGHCYATVIIHAVTHRRIDVLPDRKAATLAAWLGAHSGAQVVCRDGSATYAEAHRAGRAPGGAGQRPLAPVAQPGRCGGEDRHRPQHLLAHPACPAGVAEAGFERSTSGPGPDMRPCTNYSIRAWACSNAPDGWAGR
jgi:Transposase